VLNARHQRKKRKGMNETIKRRNTIMSNEETTDARQATREIKAGKHKE